MKPLTASRLGAAAIAAPATRDRMKSVEVNRKRPARDFCFGESGVASGGVAEVRVGLEDWKRTPVIYEGVLYPAVQL